MCQIFRCFDSDNLRLPFVLKPSLRYQRGNIRPETLVTLLDLVETALKGRFSFRQGFTFKKDKAGGLVNVVAPRQQAACGRRQVSHVDPSSRSDQNERRGPFAPRRHRLVMRSRPASTNKTNATPSLVTRFPMSFSDRSRPREKAGKGAMLTTPLPTLLEDAYRRVASSRVGCGSVMQQDSLDNKVDTSPLAHILVFPLSPPTLDHTPTPHKDTRTSPSYHLPAQPFSCWSKTSHLLKYSPLIINATVSISRSPLPDLNLSTTL
jgi:hypothetical protein